MTTAVQVKRATRPLLARNGDLALGRGFIFIKPARHLLRGVFFPRDIDPILFQPTWFVNFLSRPGAGISDRWGERLFRKTDERREPTEEETRAFAAQWAINAGNVQAG